MRSIIALPLVACVACTGSPQGDTLGESFGGPTASSTTAPDGSSSSGPPSPDSDSVTGSSSGSVDETGPTTDGGTLKLDVGSDDSGGPIPEVAEVFGHSGRTLYRLDPDTNEVVVVGDFTGLDGNFSIIDIALDGDSNMYGTAYSSLWSIDRTTAECTKIASGSYTTSLSFVPAGTVHPTEEALVGFDGAQYVRIDVGTGAVTTLGTLPGGLQSSGDVVSVKDGGTYLTVFGPGCDATDCLVELDPADGSVTRNFGPLPYDQVFGLAFWGGSAYGFAREGVLFEIEFNGDMVSTTEIPIPVAPPGLEFFGAGSTTSAPPVAG
ncbi:NHL repeat-containing protein [Paraliomyxa miuraensis]|uniref:hypothetical protein n=1 Tax=Paraliomyxa miuraensis TaxID=376150 RepID=UPI0022576DB5|nr:hypothetical protein [Paraliomyxa miuraensis]MCX4241991.1 hypothetical protein [Paraliomyxa miuraensis]